MAPGQPESSAARNAADFGKPAAAARKKTEAVSPRRPGVAKPPPRFVIEGRAS
ncbi:MULTISPECIES: hypothetical protein [Burkholderia]|uniref:hypothetical protein n=1 Tax=Burkholderia TaxID=32008 RepID=UPI000A4ED681|nr:MULTISPECIES: hypothetical protein [Burkholderia]